MPIRVEFYGLARRMAGTSDVEVACESAMPLRELLRQVEESCPGLCPDCIFKGKLKPGWIGNIDGSAFIDETDQLLEDRQTLLILPADAGG